MINKKVVCVGTVNVDVLLFVDDFCKDDGEQIIKDISIFSGGQAGNVAHGLAKLGKKSFFFGNIGTDKYTPMLLKDFDEVGVNYSYSIKTKNQNSSVYSIVNNKGLKRMYCFNDLDFSINDFSEEIYNNTSFIIFTSIQKNDAIDIYVKIAKEAKIRGIKIALDPGNIFSRLGFEKLSPLLRFCDYFFPSEDELNMLVGNNISKLLELVPNVIVTCKERGVKFFKKDEYNYNEPKIFLGKKIKRPIDTTGAGDCFVAAFISAILDGLSEDLAIDFANKAAGLSITKKGARSMPSREEIGDL